MIPKRSHEKLIRDLAENARPSYHSGMDYWKMARVHLDGANKEFAKRMNGEVYEDDRRAR